MSTAFTALHLDAFREIGNIGSGNAATALSTLLGSTIDLDVGLVELLPIEACYQFFGFSPDEMTSVTHGLSEGLNGFFWFTIAKADQHLLTDKLTMGMDIDPLQVLPEISNILAGSYLMALSSMLNMFIDLHPPSFEPITRILDHATVFHPQVLIIQNKLLFEDQTVNCFINTVLDNASLERMLSALGVPLSTSTH